MKLEATSPDPSINYLTKPRKQSTFRGINLALWAFATTFFPRVFAALGVPAAVNFLHFLTVPWVFWFVLTQSRTKDAKAFAVSKALLSGLGILFGVIVASAILNDAGVINVIFSFLLYGEPFMWLFIIVMLPMSAERLSKFRTWWMRFGLINLLFALVQSFVLRLDQANADHIKGVFIGQGSGHVVGGSVSLAFAIYYFATTKHQSVWVRSLFILAALIHLVKCDGKQVLAVFLIALLLLVLTKVKDLGKLIQYVAIATVFTGLIVIAANTVFSALLTWFDLDIQQEGMELKLVGFSILPTFYHSPLNWLLGLGPGHSISRLGGFLVWDYLDLLQPVGVTVSNASKAVWNASSQSWLGDRSSWFSPLFGWAGIWGDLGTAGVGAYLYLWWTVWRRLCPNDLSRFYVMTVLIFGTILTQIEEPGYMLFMTGIIGLNWHEHRQCLATRR
jgi:hypothetical protein